MLFGGQRGQPAPVPVVQVAGPNPAWDTTNRHCQETKCYLRNQDTSTHTTTQHSFSRETWVDLVIIFVIRPTLVIIISVLSLIVYAKPTLF